LSTGATCRGEEVIESRTHPHPLSAILRIKTNWQRSRMKSLIEQGIAQKLIRFEDSGKAIVYL
jgi:hypothetical protein